MRELNKSFFPLSSNYTSEAESAHCMLEKIIGTEMGGVLVRLQEGGIDYE